MAAPAGIRAAAWAPAAAVLALAAALAVLAGPAAGGPTAADRVEGRLEIHNRCARPVEVRTFYLLVGVKALPAAIRRVPPGRTVALRYIGRVAYGGVFLVSVDVLGVPGRALRRAFQPSRVPADGQGEPIRATVRCPEGRPRVTSARLIS